MFYSAFPPLEWAAAGWVALLPLLAVCVYVSPRAALRYGFLAGLAAWLPSIFWVTRVSGGGWLALSVYCALYPAVFAVWAAWCFKRWNDEAVFFRPALAVSAAWVALEFLRSNLFTGFPWNTLAVSQYARPELLAAAAWGGVYLVSFIMVALQVVLVLLLCKPCVTSWWKPVLAVGCLFILLGGTRIISIAQWQSDGEGDIIVNVALVQLNVPQELKWDDGMSAHIFTKLESVTAEVLENCRPDLVVWPETVMPDFFRGNFTAAGMLTRLLAYEVPIMAGSLDWEEYDDNIIYYNSSFMLVPGAGLSLSYAKRHLVIFGEYVPLENRLPFLRALTPVDGNITPGTEPVVFKLENGLAAAPLICFEDTMPHLARASVRAGGRLLVNQTNDAWFDPSSASRQHMAHCVFRCIENRVPAVRSTNTGITCFIDRYGEIYAELPPVGEHPAPAESICREVHVPPADMQLTFYTRHGDVFAVACMLYMMLVLAWPASLTVIRARRSRS